MNKFTHSILNTFWGLALGTLIWALINMLIIDKFSGDIIARIIILFLLIVYISINFYFIKQFGDKLIKYWLIDLIHVISIIVFAIIVINNVPRFGISLTAVFAITAFGHYKGAWISVTDGDAEAVSTNNGMAFINILGILIIYLSYKMVPFLYPWHYVVPTVFVLFFWFLVRINYKNFGGNIEDASHDNQESS